MAITDPIAGSQTGEVEMSKKDMFLKLESKRGGAVKGESEEDRKSVV